MSTHCNAIKIMVQSPTKKAYLLGITLPLGIPEGTPVGVIEGLIVGLALPLT
jgi:hypothetical protein